jgi:hypothetical protein
MTERQKVLHTLIGMGCFPAGMEFFPADSQDSWEHVKQVIDDSDVYVLIVGGRYGSVDSLGVSFTEREFLYAKSRQLPVLAFLHGDPGAIPSRHVDLDPKARESLQSFRNRVEQSHLCRYWTGADELAAGVAIALNHTLATTDMAGWSRGAGEPPLSAMPFHRTSHVERTHLGLEGFSTSLELRLRAGVDGAEVFFRQTGAIYPTRLASLRCLSPQMTLLDPPIRRGNSFKYFIHVGRAMKRGQEVVASIQEEYAQAGPWDAANFFGISIVTPIESCERSISYDPVMRPDTVFFNTYRGDPEHGELVDSVELSEEDSCYRVALNSPTVGTVLAMETEWSADSLSRIESARSRGASSNNV